jgi:hypothetical protein
MTDSRFDIHKIHNDLEAKKAGRKVQRKAASPLTGGRKRSFWDDPLTNRVLLVIMVSQFCAGAAVGAWLW